MRVVLLVAVLGILPACQVQDISQGGAPATASSGLGSQRRLPPALEAKDCGSIPSADELPNARFARKGGHEIKAAVKSEESLLTVDGIEQGRDLSRYVRLDLPKPPPSGEPNWETRLADARAFLWEHWRSRKPAYLTLTGSSDDATSTSHIFIEEDESGQWRVAWRIVRHLGVINDLPTYYGVEWVLPGGWRKPGKPLGRGEAADPKKHELEFRDKCGDVEQSL